MNGNGINAWSHKEITTTNYSTGDGRPRTIPIGFFSKSMCADDAAPSRNYKELGEASMITLTMTL